MSYQKWWKEVNRHVAAKIELTADDMPDLVMVRDLYDDDFTPEECAEVLLETWAAEGDLPYELIE